LQAAGIATIKDLARQNPQDLHQLIAQLHWPKGSRPTEKMLKVWIRAAQQLKGAYRGLWFRKTTPAEISVRVLTGMGRHTRRCSPHSRKVWYGESPCKGFQIMIDNRQRK
jgi:hypothetical protein